MTALPPWPGVRKSTTPTPVVSRGVCGCGGLLRGEEGVQGCRMGGVVVGVGDRSAGWGVVGGCCVGSGGVSVGAAAQGGMVGAVFSAQEV